ncbi:hypothetical protein ACWCXH_37440 [Kitasatospora sp. NPDC001660]
MTNMSVLPVAAEPPGEDEDQAQPEQQHAVNEVLAEAGEAGRVAAGWVRGLAARQAEERHRTVLGRAADAIEQTAGREVVPDGDGQLDEELAYRQPVRGSTPGAGGGRADRAGRGLRAGRGDAPHSLGRVGALPVLAATMDAAVEAGDPSQ